MKKLDKSYLNARLNILFKTEEQKKSILKFLTPENKKKLMALKDIHKGQRCFIIGSSPSVKQLDLTQLNNEIVFTVNRGYKLKDEGLKSSTYHIMSDKNTIHDDDVKNEIPFDFAKYFLIYAGILNFPIKDNTVFFDLIHNINNSKENFKDCISKPFISCGTVMAYALQLSYFMGFKEVNVIGVDLDFINTSGHAYEETDGEKKRQQEDSIKHAKIMLDGLSHISNMMIKSGINVQNASPIGVLNSIPRIKYNDLFESKI